MERRGRGCRRLVIYLPGFLFLLALPGVSLMGRVVNIGTRLADRMDDLEARVGRLEADAAHARAQWGHLRLERQVVLNASQGALFAPGEAGLTP
jgi:hypothetical protein